MQLLVIGLIVFLGTHSIAIIAPRWRERGVALLGPLGWRSLYSVLSLTGFVLLIIGYGQARLAPEVLYVPPLWLRHVAFALMLPVFPLLFAAYLPGRIKEKLKHPMLAGVKFWALAHLLANGMLADVVLFGSLLAWAVIDRISLKRRVQKPAFPLPPPSSRNDVLAVVLGLAVYAAIVLWLHRWLTGVPLVA
jgi:uncharacterized membrane protein